MDTGYVGVPYNVQLEANKADGKTVTWSVSSSTLPDGLTLNSESGIISGTPTATGTSTFTVQATIQDAGEGEEVSNTKQLSITIGAADASFGTLTVSNGNDETNTFTYGDTITVSGKITAAASSNGANALSEPGTNHVGLYLGDTELDTANVEDDGTFTLTYDTSEKDITPGEAAQTLAVRYGGSSDLNSGEATVQITLHPKPVEARFSGPSTKVYDGTTAAPKDLSLKLDDAVVGNDVSAACDSITFDTAEVGDNRLITATGISLSGSDATYYVLSDTEVTTPGSITKSDSTLTVEPSSASLTYGDTLTIKVTPERSAANGITALAAQDTVELLTSEGTVLATAEQPDNDGAYTLTYDTAGKGLSIGQNTLTVSYGGSGNLNSSIAAVTVDLSAKPVTASVSGAPSKIYDGKTDVEVALAFAGGTLAGSDIFTGTVSGNFSDANSGEGKPITLGSDPVWSDSGTAGYYAVALPETVTGTIAPAQIGGELTIAGEAVPGNTLTAEYAPVSGEDVAFRWHLDGHPIDGAAGAAYTVREADVEHAITVAATAADGNHTGSVTSEAVTAYKLTGSIEIACESVTYGETVQPSVTSTTNEGAAGTYTYTGAEGTDYPASTTAPTDAGTYIVNAAVAETVTHTAAESDPVAFTIRKAPQSAPAQDEGYIIDYPHETIQANDGYELAAAVGNAAASELSVTPGLDVYVRLAETGNHNASAWTRVDVPDRPAAPAEGVAFSVSTPGVMGGEGSITPAGGVALEYRANSEGAWSPLPIGGIVRTAGEGVELRYAAATDAFASEAAPVTMPEHVHDAEGAWLSDADGHWHVCASTMCGEQLDKEAHAFGDWSETVPVTCAEDGEKARTCTVCGYTEKRTAPVLDHAWGTWTVAQEPTATEPGREVRICERCGAEETRSIPAAGVVEEIPDEPASTGLPATGDASGAAAVACAATSAAALGCARRIRLRRRG